VFLPSQISLYNDFAPNFIKNYCDVYLNVYITSHVIMSVFREMGKQDVKKPPPQMRGEGWGWVAKFMNKREISQVLG
jgi:hypothetical protein